MLPTCIPFFGGAKLTRTCVLRVCCSMGDVTFFLSGSKLLSQVPSHSEVAPNWGYHTCSFRQTCPLFRRNSFSPIEFVKFVSVRGGVVGCLLFLKDFVYFNGNENSNKLFLKLTRSLVVIFALSSSEAKNLSFLRWP